MCMYILERVLCWPFALSNLKRSEMNENEYCFYLNLICKNLALFFHDFLHNIPREQYYRCNCLNLGVDNIMNILNILLAYFM